MLELGDLPEPVRALLHSTIGSEPTWLRPCAPGFAQQLSALAGTDRFEVFVKWAERPAGIAAILREAQNLSLFDRDRRCGELPIAPTLLGLDPASGVLCTSSIPGAATTLWDTSDLVEAAKVLERLAAASWHGVRRLDEASAVIPSAADVDRRLRELRAAGYDTRALSRDARRFTQEIVHRTDVLCHADTKTSNWVRGTDGLALVDFDHLCLGPRGWDHSYLATRLLHATGVVAHWLTTHTRPVDRVAVRSCVAACALRTSAQAVLHAPTALALHHALTRIR